MEYSKESGFNNNYPSSPRLTHLSPFYKTGNSCGPNGEGIEIMVGFDYTTSDFVPLFVTCFDIVKKANIYTKYVIPKETAARGSGNERPP